MTGMATVRDADGFERAAETRWDSVLSGLRADALDCLQSTAALIADDAYGSGAHLALGCRWRFPLRGPDGAVGVQPSLAERTADASGLLGLQLGRPEGPMSAPELRHLAATAPLYVVAEAYDLQWLPYAHSQTRYREMPHSFLLEKGRGGYTVVDGYYADTEWGRARPGAWTLSAAELDRAIDGQALAMTVRTTDTQPQVDRTAVLARNAAIARGAAHDIDSYIDGAWAGLARPEGVERLVLDIWHLCRERLLHTLWLGDHPAAAAVSAATQEWQRLAAQSYLAMRRAQRGAPPNTALLEDMARLLRSDAALVAGLAGSPPVADGEAVASAVLEALRVTLQLGDHTVQQTCALRSLPGFDSFRLVDIIDRVEVSLGVQFPADAAADDLVDVAGLCRLFARAVAHETRPVR